jgi:hypothetical protein
MVRDQKTSIEQKELVKIVAQLDNLSLLQVDASSSLQLSHTKANSLGALPKLRAKQWCEIGVLFFFFFSEIIIITLKYR